MQRFTVYIIWKLLYFLLWYYHPSSRAQTTLSTAFGICHTVIAICCYRGRVGTGLSVLWAAYVYILIYIQQDATLHSLFYLETALRVSGGAITHHQQRKQLYLQHLVFVTPLLLFAAIVEELEPVCLCCGWRTYIF